MCAPLFACDGTPEDCAEAFARGCACGDPPRHHLARVESRLPGSALRPDLFWTGAHLVSNVRVGRSDGRMITYRIDVRDASGATSRWRGHGPGVEYHIFGNHGTTLYGRLEPGAIGIFDADSGARSVRRLESGFDPPRRTDTIFNSLFPLEDGHLLLHESSAFVGDPWQGRFGVLAPDQSVARVRSVETRYGHHVIATDGRRALVGEGRGTIEQVYVYDAWADTLSGPHAFPYSAMMLAFPIPTGRGWLGAGWARVEGDHRRLRFVALDHEGAVTSSIDGGVNIMEPRLATNGEEHLLLYDRIVLDHPLGPHMLHRAELVVLRVDDEGRPLGTPRAIAETWTRFNPHGLAWAGYS
ncbi:MAG: hypothetical protein KF729_39195, partial [Sandaracinaceae bacterium]|nr:hypothetical protein [Sandaracinaceae bacterium]